MSFQYIMHGTSLQNFISILKYGYIFGTYDDDRNVYTQYISNNIEYKGLMFRHALWGNVIILLNINILKNKKFIILNGIGGSNQNVIIDKYSISNIEKLTNIINTNILYKRKKNLKKGGDGYALFQSHEILFYKIPIKYIQAVMVNKTHVKSLPKNFYQILDNNNIKLIKYDTTDYDWRKYFSEGTERTERTEDDL